MSMCLALVGMAPSCAVFNAAALSPHVVNGFVRHHPENGLMMLISVTIGTLGILGRSGVPLVDALFIAAQVVGNLAIRDAVKHAAVKVREGGNLSRALDASGYFPPMLVQMIASGEASGELDHMLTRAADYQERELTSTVNTMVGLLGPIMLLVMASVVVLIVLSVMLPIMQMNNLIAG